MKYFWAALILITFSHCANQTSPGGGPQDKKPPELVSSNPTNNQKNFTGKNIELVFDEYVKLKAPDEEVLISPSIGKEIKYTAKKNKVIISTKATWKENTTYSIAFRESIQDITESNPANNLRLAFSTGPTIDSLQINGRVTELFKEEAPDKITIALYSSDTFNIFKHTPTYFTRAGKTGKFSIQNLKPGGYYIYAFDDKNKNLIVESKSERFGFKKDKIEIPSKDSLRIELMKVDARPIKVTSFRSSEKVATLRLNKAVTRIKVNPYLRNDFIYYFGTKQDEVIFRNLKEEKSRDSIQLDITLTDSLDIQKDTSVYLKFNNSRMSKEKFSTSYGSLQFDQEQKSISQTIRFNKLLSSINYDSVFIQVDTTTFQPINNQHITFDTLNLTLHLSTTIEKALAATPPILVYGVGSFISIEQDSSKSKTETVRILKPDQVGSLAIKVETKEPYFFIELINRASKVVYKLNNIKEFTFKNLEPGDYKLRITIDPNNNHKWDIGNYIIRSEPERIILFKTFDGKTVTPVRANWEVGPLTIKF
ncbi:MAG: Ig-like domain-containing protein [Bacteroidetes bacterium]|nr:Ig-like domain-containing protein [Bacteroidota bacterium]